jgi:hypothetical protein
MIEPPPLIMLSFNVIDLPPSDLINPPFHSPISIFYTIISPVDVESTVMMNYPSPSVSKPPNNIIYFSDVMFLPYYYMINDS